VKILVVDDHAVVREGVAAVLREAIADLVVLQASDAQTGIDVATTHQPDLILLDLAMPGTVGMGALELFSLRHPALPVVVLSSSEEQADVRAAIGRGALGYIPKSVPPATLIAALQLVLSGEIYVPTFMAAGPAPAGSNKLEELTVRQREILVLIGQEATNKQIAHRLGISEKTVKSHVSAIFRALKVTSRTAAARAAPLWVAPKPTR
jgi:two-component system nitrate/nitrite response regulator NarL